MSMSILTVAVWHMANVPSREHVVVVVVVVAIMVPDTVIGDGRWIE
jgi:hypothetical protein